MENQEYIRDKKLLLAKKRHLKIAKANLTNELNKTKLSRLEKTIVDNNLRSSTPFESRSGSREFIVDKFGSEIGQSKFKKSSVDDAIYNLSSKNRFSSLKSIGSKRNSASVAMSNTFQYVATGDSK